MKKLLLFDIDGTMLHTHGVGRRAVEQATRELLGFNVDTKPVSFSGKTDPQIMREVLALAGLDKAKIDGTLPRMIERYKEIMFETLTPDRITVLPGVQDLVKRLHDEASIQLSVLTGNLEPMAHLNLEAIGLGGYFPFGAFGSDSEDRNDLPAIAVERAREYTSRQFTGKDIIIIGDTEHDIRCGAGTGAMCIGVCTGNYTRADLEPHGPDVILDDLSDYRIFEEHVLV